MKFLNKLKSLFIKKKGKDFYSKRGDKLEESTSPSGNYKLEIYSYKTRKGCWNVTQAVIRTSTGDLVAKVKRNYSSFWYFWIVHSNGKEYLLCGEDYQGQTIVDLNNKNVMSVLPKEAEQGAGYCWAHIVGYDRDRNQLTVDGCFWGDQYTRRIYDFSNPENFPYKLIKEYDTLECEKCECDIVYNMNEHEQFLCRECYEHYCEECLFDHDKECKELVGADHATAAWSFSTWVLRKMNKPDVKNIAEDYFLKNKMWEEHDQVLESNPDSSKSALNRMHEYYDKTYIVKYYEHCEKLILERI